MEYEKQVAKRLKTKDSGLRTKVIGTSVIPEVYYRESGFKHLDSCLEHAGMTEGVKRLLYPIQQITRFSCSTP
ncbi:MAG: hypothetical protein HFP77_07635 [Methylococcales symbiont of Iophon sp. n. MRB-2018]|nr:MAG: hypothetical protein HFP77_07635 [Methylococcales symbiont of Iophon sp. n. MRB-2018]KAF3979781.1 MAG: hypothetical protein HFP76_05520 [Methylococcales symbiont of Iophon sp. n. MRB-2018]